jgi:hypothetical protein
MPFADGSFRTIISTFPAGYIFEPKTWTEVARLLGKPGKIGPDKGRFVVVGVCVHATSGKRWSFSRLLFGLPDDALLDHFQHLAGQANLHLTVEVCRLGSFELPILISEH